MAEEKIVYLTQAGLEEKKKRLAYLQTERRNEISEQIKYAKSLGDFSENAELDAAKEEENNNEKEINELVLQLSNYVIIEASTYKILDLEDNEQYTFTIVGPTEANIAENKISADSPLAQALRGSKKGETVVVKTVNPYKVKVLSID